ncbi:MAG: TIGR01244 family sulfur transferase [Roseovarius sp.]
MDIRPLTSDIAVSPQIDAAHVKDIAGAGFRSILCNRPDGEEAGQTAFAAIEAAARAEGLEVRCVPIVSGMLTPGGLSDFDLALKELPKPILAYCRSGTRCTMLWAAVEHGRRADDEIIACAAKAGYDVAPLVRQMQAR